MTERFDAIVIGAGHNGLVCASLLAKAGKDVLVLEARESVGGLATTAEFAEGFRASRGAHLLYGWQPEVAEALGIEAAPGSEPLATIGLDADGAHVRLQGNEVIGADADGDAYRRFGKRIRRFAKLLNAQLNRVPPRLNGERANLLRLAKLGFDIRRLGRDDMREFLRVIGMNIYDEVHERFTHPGLRGVLCLDAVLGTHLGPRSPNTYLTYLYRHATGAACTLPAGGLGAFSERLANHAVQEGVTLRTATPVKRVVVDNGRVVGVELADGDLIESLTVISNADPKRTVMQLTGAQHFETGFVRRIHHLRARGDAAKLHLALDRLPEAENLSPADFGHRLVIAPDADYVERAFNPAKYGECSPAPVMEITFPSAHDKTLAPEGQHVMSAVVQYAPYALEGGWTSAARADFESQVIETLSYYFPHIRDRIVASELLTPADLEQEFGASGGHWHHAELTLDQFLFTRPVGGAQQYALPLDGLYLCGAGAHPGGNVSGAAGRNAAMAILARDK